MGVVSTISDAAIPQFFVSIICVAIALPVSLFIENLFEQANEVEGAKGESCVRRMIPCLSSSLPYAPLAEGWLSFGGKWKTVLGAHAHADWHWTDDTRERPSELVRWLAASDDPYFGDVVRFLIPWAFRRVIAFLMGKSAGEAEEERKGDDESEDESIGEDSDATAHSGPSAGSKKGGGSNAGDSDNSDERRNEDRMASLTRRLRAAGGLLAVYVSWACFAYFTFVYGMVRACALVSERVSPLALTLCPRLYTERSARQPRRRLRVPGESARGWTKPSSGRTS